MSFYDFFIFASYLIIKDNNLSRSHILSRAKVNKYFYTPQKFSFFFVLHASKSLYSLIIQKKYSFATIYSFPPNHV